VTIEVGGIAFDREGSSNAPLNATDTITNVQILTNEEGSDLGSAAGVQGKVVFPSRRTGQKFEFRGSYTGWDEEANVAGPNFNSPFVLGGIFRLSDLIGFDPANPAQPVNPVLPVGVTIEDLALSEIPLSTGDITALELVWPGLPDSFFVDGVSAPPFGDIFDVESINSRYQSDYASLELMSRRNTRPGLTWLYGPRYISVNEESQITALGTAPTRIFFAPGTVVDTGATEQATAASRTDTRNSLIGLQLGLEYNMPISQDIYFQISGRGGAFYNSSSVARSASPLLQTSQTNAGDFSALDRDTDSGESWLAEINIRGYVDLIPNTLSAYAGYDVLFIDQLALAPDQSISIDEVDTSGDLFARGFSFGVKMNY